MKETFAFDSFEFHEPNARGPFVRKTRGEAIRGEKANHTKGFKNKEQARVLDCRGPKVRLTYMKDSRSVFVDRCAYSSRVIIRVRKSNLRVIMRVYRGHKETKGVEAGM